MLLEMQRASYPIQVVYDLFCDELEACLPCVFGLRRGMPALPPDAPDERLLLAQHHSGGGQQAVPGLQL